MGINPGWLRDFTVIAKNENIKSGDSFLDIGASELFCEADPQAINDFVTYFGGKPYPEDELKALAARGNARGAFNRAGLRYAAVDYANYADIIRLDLNHDVLPKKEYGRYQFVANLGTSEHILNQYNVFNVIHDACAVGGMMMHSVPSFGDYEHGVVNYSPKFFWALATANNYQIVQFAGWAEETSSPLREDFVQKLSMRNVPITQKVWLHIIFRKLEDKPFAGLNDPAFSPENTDPRDPSARDSKPVMGSASPPPGPSLARRVLSKGKRLLGA